MREGPFEMVQDRGQWWLQRDVYSFEGRALTVLEISQLRRLLERVEAEIKGVGTSTNDRPSWCDCAEIAADVDPPMARKRKGRE
jgi:hypothetical protein